MLLTGIFGGEGDDFFSLLRTMDSGDLIELATGEPFAADIGVRRVKKFIRFCVLYRSRIALTSVFIVVEVCDDVNEADEEGAAGGEVVDDVGDVVDVREGVLERIRLDAVGA